MGGKLPDHAKYVENRRNRMRRGLEASVKAIHGAISTMQECHINTALKWEVYGALCQLELRTHGDTLSVEKRLDISERIAKASANRDRALEKLGLDRDSKETLIAGLYEQQPRLNYASEETAEPEKGESK